MAKLQLGVIEVRFADIIREHEPVTSSELVKLAAEAFSWKRTTTHTVLKRLCDKGLFENNNRMVDGYVILMEVENGNTSFNRKGF